MKSIQINYLIFSLLLFYSCKQTQHTHTNKGAHTETHLSEINDFKFNKSLIVGSWIDTSESAQHFTLLKNGSARSDNSYKLFYKNWSTTGHSISFTIERKENGISYIHNETFDIEKLDENQLILKTGKRILHYTRLNETFEIVNTDELTKTLKKIKANLSAQDVMRLYYPTSVNTQEGYETLEITEAIEPNGNITVTLIHDNLLDDSAKGVKYVMVLKNQHKQWQIISLKRNWKCQKDRGHSYWGVKWCS